MDDGPASRRHGSTRRAGLWLWLRSQRPSVVSHAMRIVIPGGTGRVGTLLARAFSADRHDVVVSTATIYAHRFDAPNHEATGVIGGTEPDAPASWRFSIRVATAWERAASGASLPDTRLVLLRSAMVMSPDPGGIFATLLRLARFGLGGPVAGGRQYISWIHERDFVRALHWLIDHAEFSGAVNIAAPHPLPYRDFMREIRRAAGVPIGLPATRWMLAFGTWALRTESELVLKSRRVVPGRLAESGFTFEYPAWPSAAAELVTRARSRVAPPREASA